MNPYTMTPLSTYVPSLCATSVAVTQPDTEFHMAPTIPTLNQWIRLRFFLRGKPLSQFDYWDEDEFRGLPVEPGTKSPKSTNSVWYAKLDFDLKKKNEPETECLEFSIGHH